MSTVLKLNCDMEEGHVQEQSCETLAIYMKLEHLVEE